MESAFNYQQGNVQVSVLTFQASVLTFQASTMTKSKARRLLARLYVTVSQFGCGKPQFFQELGLLFSSAVTQMSLENAY